MCDCNYVYVVIDVTESNTPINGMLFSTWGKADGYRKELLGPNPEYTKYFVVEAWEVE